MLIALAFAWLQESKPAQPPPAETPPTETPPAETVLVPQDAASKDAEPVAPSDPSAPVVVAGQTWATAGSEHSLFACHDVNKDGFDDVVVMTPQRTLLVAETVRGWKASPWKALDPSAWPGGLDGFERAARQPFAPARVSDAPPYEPTLAPLASFPGDLDGDGHVDTISLFRCSRPHDFLDLRVGFAPNANADDTDGDGVPNSQELALGSNPEDRDTDDDGLLDGWEVFGLPRGISIGPGNSLDPKHQDVICAVAPYEGVDLAALPAELERVKQLYAALATTNPDGTRGVRVHPRIDPVIPNAKNFGGDWGQCGNAYFAPKERGMLHWMQVTPWGGGQSSETSDMGGAGWGFAVFAHEFGHQLSLGHTGDSAPVWCPLYPSLMNYAFSYALNGDGNAIRFSDGRFRATVLEEQRLVEKLPYPHAELAYLATWPFRFTLKENGPNETLIDWNQNGRFDEQPVSADVNYGSSTNCGIRRDAGLTAAAPALGYAAGTCYLAQVVPEQGAITLKTYLGSEEWSEPRVVPDSATNGDPLLVGNAEQGFLFFRRAPHWLVARFDASSIDAPVAVNGLVGASELGAGLVGGRILLVARSDDDSLRAFWFAHDGKAANASLAQELELRSQVAPGIAEEPGTGRIVMASAMTNSAGAPMCMRVTWFKLAGDKLVDVETKWVRGEAAGTQCSTRPSVIFDADGQLNVFHTVIAAGNGLMTGWRTRRIGNQAFDEGWLTSMLYDIWTSSRRAVSATTGPQGAIYAFRWDADGWTKNNTILVGHNAFGIDPEPMRDFDDGEKIAKYGLVHSILWLQPEPPGE
ncbi:MAG: hypothetical protein L6Q99_06125 [Planctomycetes bacterium]|nr:hypothetical protein [Planctomycetota bacterium]